MTLMILSEGNIFGSKLAKLYEVMEPAKRFNILKQFANYLMPEYVKKIIEVMETNERFKAAWSAYFTKYHDKKAEEITALFEEFTRVLLEGLSVKPRKTTVDIDLIEGATFGGDLKLSTIQIFNIMEYGAAEVFPARVKGQTYDYFVANFQQYWEAFVREYNLDIDEALVESILS